VKTKQKQNETGQAAIESRTSSLPDKTWRQFSACLPDAKAVAINLLEATIYYKIPPGQGHAEGQLGYAICMKKSSHSYGRLSEATDCIRLTADCGDTDG
jgi:hypothetical protein